MKEPMLAPMLAMVLWTFVMWVWMYATRIPAIRAAGLDPAKVTQKSDLDVLPLAVRQVADNYNHLHEQPTLFYALVTCCVLGAAADSTNVLLAWAYVATRVVHSLVQCTVNFIPLRFAVFTIASFLLFAIGIRCAIAFAG